MIPDEEELGFRKNAAIERNTIFRGRYRKVTVDHRTHAGAGLFGKGLSRKRAFHFCKSRIESAKADFVLLWYRF